MGKIADNTTVCDLQTGTPTTSRSTTTDSYVRILPAAAESINVTRGSVVQQLTADFVMLPGARCRLDPNAARSKNESQVEFFRASNITACKRECAAVSCTCFDYQKARGPEVGAPAGATSRPYVCRMMHATVGRGGRFNTTGAVDMSAAFFSASSIASVAGRGEGVHLPGSGRVTRSALQIFGDIALFTTPVVLILIILYVLMGDTALARLYRTACCKRHCGIFIRGTPRSGHHHAHETPTGPPDETPAGKVKASDSIFLRYIRTARNFMNTPHVPYDFPRDGVIPYRKTIEWTGAWYVRYWQFITIRETVIRKCVKPALLVGSIAALWAWCVAVMRPENVLDQDGDHDGGAAPDTEDTFWRHLKVVADLHKLLVTPATFVLVYSLNEAVKKYHEKLTAMCDFQHAINSTAFMLGAGFSQAPIRLRPLAFKMYRYLNVFHFLTYLPLVLKLNEVGLDDLVRCNLLTQDEANTLNGNGRVHPDVMRRRILTWLWDTLEECAEKGVHKKQFGRLEKQFTKIRTGAQVSAGRRERARACVYFTCTYIPPLGVQCVCYMYFGYQLVHVAVLRVISSV